MRKFELRVDVTEAVGTGEELEVAATLVLPERGMTSPGVVMFGFPGGGYSRSYYDLPIEGGYSQAEHNAGQGIVFVACDHLGVGDSSVPARTLDFMAVARANAAAAVSIVSRLREGSVDGSDGMDVKTVVGIGQSFGGFILTLGEGTDPVFDAVALLGWSGIETLPPWPPDVDMAAIMAGTAGNGLDNPMRPVFHAADVPEDIVIADMTKKPGQLGSAAPWSADHMPGGPAVVDLQRGPLGPGVVAAEAAAIRTPVFVGAGDIDVLADPYAEPTAYRSSRHVTVCVFPGMAHMHNFATTRADLWDRLAAWAESLRPRR